MFVGKLRAPKTSDGKSAVGIFRHVSYTHLGTIFGFCWSMEDKISMSNDVTRRKPKIASMRNGRIRDSDVPVAIRSVIFGLPRIRIQKKRTELA